MSSPAHPTETTPLPVTRVDRPSPIHSATRGAEFEVPPFSPLASGSYVNFESPPVKPLALSSEGSRLFVANTPNHRLMIFDTSAGMTLISEIPVGIDPVAVAVQPGTGDNLIWVANFISDNVSIVDASLGRVVDVIEVGDEPVNILFDSTGSAAFVVIQGIGKGAAGLLDPQNVQEGNVVVVDTASRQVVSTTYLECNSPRAAVYDEVNQRVVVAALFSGNNTTVVGIPVVLETIDPPPAEPTACDMACNCLCRETTVLELVRDFPPTADLFSSMPGLGVWPDPHQAPGFPASPLVHRIVPDTGTPGGWQSIVSVLDDGNGEPNPLMVQQMNLHFGIQNAEEVIRLILEEGHDTVDRDLVVLDASNPSSPSGLPIVLALDNVGTTLTGMGRDPTTGRLFVANMQARNIERLVQNLRGDFVDHQVVIVDSVMSAASAIDLHEATATFDDVSGPNIAAQTSSLANPTDIVFNSDGRYAYVAALGVGRVGALNALTGRVVGLVDVGRGPRGLAIDSAQNLLYVLNRTDLSISIVDVTNPLDMTVASTVNLFNPEPPMVRDGRDFLYSTRFSNNFSSSCAACHIDGHMDHLAWDLGNPQGTLQPGPPNVPMANHPLKGPMVTLSLKGLRNHNFLHWRSDKPTFQDFNEAFVNLLGAEQELSTGDMNAFTAFVETLVYSPSPFYKKNNAFEHPRALDGALIYLTSCEGCHQLGHDGSLNGTTLIPPVDGDGGMDLNGGSLFAQLQEVTQMRGLVKKLQSDRFNGFGLLHDGREDREEHDNPLQTFLLQFFPGFDEQERLDLIAFMNAFQSNVMSVVGWQVRAKVAAGEVGIPLDVQTDLMTMIAQHQKQPSHCDVVAHGVVGAAAHGYFLISVVPEATFQRDDGNSLGLTALLASLGEGDSLVFTAVPPGSGRRMGIDQDLDCLGDGLDPAPQLSNAADGDFDGHIGVLDFLAMVDCAALDGPVGPGCAVFDMDCGGTIDSNDLEAFVALYEEPLADCNGNGVPDLSDIFTGASIDADRDGIPDFCVSVTVESVAARYIKIQVLGTEPSALRITSPEYACLEKYADSQGFLADAPVTRTPSEWGTVFVGDADIIPSTIYHVSIEIDGAISAPMVVGTFPWGEVNGIAPIDVDDMVCVLDAFSGTNANCTIFGTDLMGPVPNRMVDVDDILAVLDGFAGNGYPFSSPCP